MRTYSTFTRLFMMLAQASTGGWLNSQNKLSHETGR
jgi:hypothetical protein